MQVSSKVFFDGLNVSSKHFIKLFKSIGVENVFFYSKDDLEKISNLSMCRYKSAMVVNRAKSFLEAE